MMSPLASARKLSSLNAPKAIWCPLARATIPWRQGMGLTKPCRPCLGTTLQAEAAPSPSVLPACPWRVFQLSFPCVQPQTGVCSTAGTHRGLGESQGQAGKVVPVTLGMGWHSWHSWHWSGARGQGCFWLQLGINKDELECDTAQGWK